MRRALLLGVLVLLPACEHVPSPALALLTPTAVTHDLSGTVRSAGGGPLTGATVTFTTGRRATTVTEANARGFYRIGGLEPGTVVLTVSAPGYLAVTRTLSITSDVVLDVDLDPLPISN